MSQNVGCTIVLYWSIQYWYLSIIHACRLVQVRCTMYIAQLYWSMNRERTSGCTCTVVGVVLPQGTHRCFCKCWKFHIEIDDFMPQLKHWMAPAELRQFCMLISREITLHFVHCHKLSFASAHSPIHNEPYANVEFATAICSDVPESIQCAKTSHQ